MDIQKILVLNFSKCSLFFSFLTHSEAETEAPLVKPSMRHLPVSYIKAFAYQPVAFPAPLAPITTYQVSKGVNQNQPNQQYSRSNLIQQFLQQQQARNGNPMYSISGQGDYTVATVTQPPTTTPVPTTTTTTTTPAPQPAPQERQWFGYSGYNSVAQNQFPYYNQQGQYASYSNQNPNHNAYQSNRQSAFQYYTVDPSTYQFIPTNVNHQNGLQFVPCMCPIGVNVINPDPADRGNSQGQQLPQTTPYPVTTPQQQQQQQVSQIQIQYPQQVQPPQPSIPSQYVVQPETNSLLTSQISSQPQSASGQVSGEEGI